MLNDLITFKEEDGGANWRLWVPKGQKLNVVRQTTLMNTTAVDGENYLRHFSYKSKIYRNVLNRQFCANKGKKERSESRGRKSKSRSRSMAGSNDERKTIPRQGTAFRIGGIPLTWIICRLLFQVVAVRKAIYWSATARLRRRAGDTRYWERSPWAVRPRLT